MILQNLYLFYRNTNIVQMLRQGSSYVTRVGGVQDELQVTVEDVARDEGGVQLKGGHALLQLHPHLPAVRPAEFLQSE